MPRITIFYSWQSDLPNRTNRGLIGDALEKAAKGIHADSDLDIEPVIDRDTLGEPGAPDIVGAILAKIDRAAIVVADVSIVCRGAGRAVPNPNVLVEFGYALKAVGPKRVIPVVNLHYGTIEELPFDLRGRRVFTYRLAPDGEASEVRRELQSKLGEALRTVLNSTVESARRQRGSAFISRVLGDLVTIQTFGDEAPRRDINPWHDEVTDNFGRAATRLREAATDSCADELACESQLEGLAARLDAVAQHHRTLGRESWRRHLDLINAALEETRALQATLLSDASVGEESTQEVRSVLGNSLRLLESWIARVEKAAEVGREMFKEMVDAASETGHKMVRISYYPVAGLAEDERAKLRLAAQNLHLLWSDYRVNHNAEPKSFEKIKGAAEVLRAILLSLSLS